MFPLGKYRNKIQYAASISAPYYDENLTLNLHYYLVRNSEWVDSAVERGPGSDGARQEPARAQEGTAAVRSLGVQDVGGVASLPVHLHIIST